MRKLLLIFLAALFIGAVSGLNLSEANVVDVEKEGDRFSVTMIHDDSSENGYANWWQIEDTEGNMLGRRELLHPHGTRNFTRSKSVQTDEDKLVVRAHDQTHGYGGQTILYNTETGEKEKVQQGKQKQTIKAEESGNISEVKKEEKTEENKSQATETENNSQKVVEQSQDETSLIEDITAFLKLLIF